VLFARRTGLDQITAEHLRIIDDGLWVRVKTGNR